MRISTWPRLPVEIYLRIKRMSFKLLPCLTLLPRALQDRPIFSLRATDSAALFSLSITKPSLFQTGQSFLHPFPKSPSLSIILQISIHPLLTDIMPPPYRHHSSSSSPEKLGRETLGVGSSSSKQDHAILFTFALQIPSQISILTRLCGTQKADLISK